MMEQYLKEPANANLMSDISSMAYKTCIFAAENLYPLYETDEQVSRVYTLIYSIWDIFKSLGPVVDQITEVLKGFIALVANPPQLVPLVKAFKKILLLQDYYIFNRMYVNFYKRRSKQALVVAYKLIFKYVSLKKANPILY